MSHAFEHLSQPQRPPELVSSASTRGKPTADDCSANPWSGFYRLGIAERQCLVAQQAGLSERQRRVLCGDEGLSIEQADHMAENVLGVTALPLGVCVHLRVDGQARLVPMAIEEPSVIAAASHAAKLLSAGGGVCTVLSPAHMTGQIQLLDVPDLASAEQAIHRQQAELIRRANECDPGLVGHGGGAVDVEVRLLPNAGAGDPLGAMLVVHLVVDVRDAMGANTVNTMCEALAGRLEQLSGGRARLRIVSNLADRRTVTARGQVPFEALRGKGGGSSRALARGIVEASVFAERDPYRAATHNKGIMNGVDAVLVAFGQDWRAVEAGAHAYAARSGRYTALARWRIVNGALSGTLELPVAVGVVGGVTAVHPTCRVAHQLAGVRGASDLASMVAAVGLAQNLGALRALAAEGIQAGHMRIHARNLAVVAGAIGAEVDQVAREVSAGDAAFDVATASAALWAHRARRIGLAEAHHVKARFTRLRGRFRGPLEDLVRDVVGQSCGADSPLARMCDYQLGTGGKRLRALLPLLVAETLGLDPARLVPFGAACEVLHNATLVHDDLQDGDRLRRGRETVWHRFGAAQAINLGDAMFYYPLLLIGRLDVPVARREATAHRLLTATLRVIDGQERELALRGRACPALDEYFAMVEGKTSGLFALPIAGAGELCGAGGAVVAALAEAARHLGVLFQIQDDVLDLYGDKGRGEHGSDIREGKRSVLVVHALRSAEEERAQWLRRVLDAPRERTRDSDVTETIELLRHTGSLAFALGEMARRQRLAARAAGRADHPLVPELVAGLAELFTAPIAPIIREHGGCARHERSAAAHGATP